MMQTPKPPSLLAGLRLKGKDSTIETKTGETYTGEVLNLDDNGYVTILQDNGTLITIPKDTVKVIKTKDYGDD